MQHGMELAPVWQEPTQTALAVLAMAQKCNEVLKESSAMVLRMLDYTWRLLPIQQETECSS